MDRQRNLKAIADSPSVLRLGRVRRILCTALFLIGAGSCLSQGPADRSLFGPHPGGRDLHPPLTLEPLVVTGTLGEFRSHSFHYGLDFSTGGAVGATVHAVADGHVRRIVYGRYGIGYGIWIEHADGRTSKYGHLQSFSSRLLTHPRMKAHREDILLRRDFSLHLPAGELPVRRGEVIARSGESGIGFAHLHFEYMQGQVRLDPLQTGLRLRDRTTPLLRELTIVPAAPGASVNGQTTPLRLKLVPLGPPRWQSPELPVHQSSGTGDGQALSDSTRGPREDNETQTIQLATEVSDGPGYYLQEFRLARPPRGTRSFTLRGRGELALQLDAYDPARPGSRSRLGLAAGELREILATPAADAATSSTPPTPTERVRFRFHIDQLSPTMAPYHALLFDRFRTKLGGGARYLYNYYERAPGRLPFIQSDATRGRITLTPQSAGTRAPTPERKFILEALDAAGNRSRLALRFVADARGPAGTLNARAVGLHSLELSASEFQKIAEPFVRTGGPGTRAVPIARSIDLQSADGQAALAIHANDHFEHLVLRLRPIPRSFRKLPAGLRWWSPRAYAFERIVAGPQGRAITSPYIDFIQSLRGSLIVPPAPDGNAELPRKLGVYRIDTRKVTPVSVPQPGGLARLAGLLDGDRAHFRTRSTGIFAAIVDEAPPRIVSPKKTSYGRQRQKPAALRAKPGDAYTQSAMRLFLKVEDEGAGPDYPRLKVTVDGKAAYTDHDPDRDAAEVFYPEHVRAVGEHLLEAVACDRAGNQSAKLRYRYHVVAD